MPLRSFTTRDGVRWDVWGVRPLPGPTGRTERRVRERRGQDLLLYKGPERRRSDRRQAAPPQGAGRPELQTGWLVFESARERRRLSPPPPGWETLPEATLVDLLRRARIVPSLGFRFQSRGG